MASITLPWKRLLHDHQVSHEMIQAERWVFHVIKKTRCRIQLLHIISVAYACLYFSGMRAFFQTGPYNQSFTISAIMFWNIYHGRGFKAFCRGKDKSSPTVVPSGASWFEVLRHRRPPPRLLLTSYIWGIVFFGAIFLIFSFSFFSHSVFGLWGIFFLVFFSSLTSFSETQFAM